jgi:hypothetical protein
MDMAGNCVTLRPGLRPRAFKRNYWTETAYTLSSGKASRWVTNPSGPPVKRSPGLALVRFANLEPKAVNA